MPASRNRLPLRSVAEAGRVSAPGLSAIRAHPASGARSELTTSLAGAIACPV
jgi:hypothetical protein